jgi:hypothetical protein
MLPRVPNQIRSINFSTIYRGLMITRACNLECGRRYVELVCVWWVNSSESSSQSYWGYTSAWCCKFLAKDVPLWILTGLTEKAESLLNVHYQLEKTQVARVAGSDEHSHLLHVCQWKFSIAWVQKDTAIIATSTPVKVWDSERTWFLVSH